MSEDNLEKVNTKLKAYKLVHDPVVLLNLIYSKYGDIEEDYDLLHINQLVYDKSSRYNIYFKEYQFLNNNDEFLKRYYKKYESKPRIPKLSEYYKNYHLFFCRPNFVDTVISDLMENYGDDKAEVFYKDNYENTNSKNEQTEKHNSESLSSLDNITDNKIIFTKKTKKIIDNNLDNNYGTLTLTTNSIKSNLNNTNNQNSKNENKTINSYNYNDGLISGRSLNGSFEKIVHNLVFYKKSKKYEKKRNEINNRPSKIIIHNNGKRNSNKVGGTYANKKINKNIIYSLNINNNTNNINNSNKHFKSIHNKNSLFSLLKSKKILHYMKTDNNNTNKNNIDKQNNMAISMNLNKSHNKNANKSISNKKFGSPTNIKDNNAHITSNLEDFHNTALRPNTSFHHKRNKTVYFTINQITGSTNPSNNYISTLSSILKNNNNYSRNYVDPFKNSRPTQFNNYLTINNTNNVINKQKGFNEKQNRMKNKTFEVDNIMGLKDNLRIYYKNKVNNGGLDINNQIIIKKNNVPTVSGSKFSLIKNPLKTNNTKININKNVKNKLQYFNPKISPINCFNKNVINNNKNAGCHKKSQTTILSNILEASPKNQIFSPISMVKHQNKIYNINKSESITSKIKPKIGNHKINNLNINFNNVIFNAPLSNLNQNINFNNNFINNTNDNLSYKLLTPTSKFNNFNNTFSNNKTNNSNIINIKESHNDKNNYITNLKNFCNFSRNKVNIYNGSLSQNDENYSVINNNSNNKKIIYEKNKISNQTYSNLYSNEKDEIFKKKKMEIIIPKPMNKKIGFKNSGTKTSGQIKKTKKKIEGRNRQFEGEKITGKTENFKKININERLNDVYFKTKEDKNSEHIYSSPYTSGRIFTIQPINVNRNSNLISKKIVKTKQKIKLK